MLSCTHGINTTLEWLQIITCAFLYSWHQHYSGMAADRHLCFPILMASRLLWKGCRSSSVLSCTHGINTTLERLQIITCAFLYSWHQHYSGMAADHHLCFPVLMASTLLWKGCRSSSVLSCTHGINTTLEWLQIITCAFLYSWHQHYSGKAADHHLCVPVLMASTHSGKAADHHLCFPVLMASTLLWKGCRSSSVLSCTHGINTTLERLQIIICAFLYSWHQHYSGKAADHHLCFPVLVASTLNGCRSSPVLSCTHGINTTLERLQIITCAFLYSWHQHYSGKAADHHLCFPVLMASTLLWKGCRSSSVLSCTHGINTTLERLQVITCAFLYSWHQHYSGMAADHHLCFPVLVASTLLWNGCRSSPVLSCTHGINTTLERLQIITCAFLYSWHQHYSGKAADHHLCFPVLMASTLLWKGCRSSSVLSCTHGINSHSDVKQNHAVIGHVWTRGEVYSG